MASSSDPFSNDLENTIHRISQFRVSQANDVDQDEGESSNHHHHHHHLHRRSIINAIDVEEILQNKLDNDIAFMALCEDGSKILQDKLMKNDERYKTLTFNAVLRHMFVIITNQFGNQVFSRLTEHCSDSQNAYIVAMLTSQEDMFVQILCNAQGSNSVKRLIKLLRTSSLIDPITLVLATRFKTLISNRIASYVILKCFEFLNVHQIKHMYEILHNDCIEVATDERACLALNESFKYLKRPYRDLIFQKICGQARFLAQDPSGNYVLQKVLALHNITHNVLIYSSLKGYFVEFCTQKASSHVVEKCLECTNCGMSYVLNDFLKYDQLWRIARDQYGNYVIQKALKLAKDADHPLYPELVKKLYKDKELYQNGHGKHVYAIITRATSQRI